MCIREIKNLLIYLLKPYIHCRLYKRKQQKSYHDQHAKSLQPLRSQQVVRLQTDRGYQKEDIVKQPAPQPRSYIVEAEGKKYWTEDIYCLFQNRLLLNLLALQRPMMTYHLVLSLHLSSLLWTVKPDLVPHHLRILRCLLSPIKTPLRPSVPEGYVTRYGRTVKPNPKFRDFVAW